MYNSPFRNPFNWGTKESLQFDAYNQCYAVLEERKQLLAKYQRHEQAMFVQEIQCDISEKLLAIKES